jgi:hypothetical protein
MRYDQDSGAIRGSRDGSAVRLFDGRWHCTQCGAVLDLPGDKEPEVIIKSQGGALTMRTLNVDGRELHRCPMVMTRSPTKAARVPQ